MKSGQLNRGLEIAQFLARFGWDRAEIFPIEADFSSRRYARLMKDDNARAFFMDADADQHTPEFVLIDQCLRGMGLSAPEIIAADPENGLVLMEDFGGRNFGALIDAGHEAMPFYRRAVDVLVHIHKNFNNVTARDLDIPLFGGALFASQAELFIDAYIPHLKGRETTRDEGENYRAAWKTTLKGIEALPQSLLLRDFMPDNLMDLPNRAGVAGVGLLDFQDAGLGPIAYDLASLCEVVRRDGGDRKFDDMIDYYYTQAKPPLGIDELKTACRILAVQRHMRILGIIAKLAQKTGRREKLAYIPRIRTNLAHLLKYEALNPVRLWAEQAKIGLN